LACVDVWDPMADGLTQAWCVWLNPTFVWSVGGFVGLNGRGHRVVFNPLHPMEEEGRRGSVLTRSG